MTEDEKKEYVREHFLEDAIKDLYSVGRYWNGPISRTMTGALRDVLAEEGYVVSVWEIPPEWEHVFYLTNGAGRDNSEQLKEIAIKRSLQKEKGVSEHHLAK